MTAPGLALTKPYPFARLRALFAGVEPPCDIRPISLGIGEPRHPTPKCITDALVKAMPGIAHYPADIGSLELREAIAHWCLRRYGVDLDPCSQVLPTLGSREALFSFVQSHIDPREGANVVMPTPFYQIYEGAALMAGAKPVYLPLSREDGFQMHFEMLGEDVLAKTQIVFICSPSNPTGATVSLEQWKELFELSDRYEFVIAADECYSEIYFKEGNAPVGALEAARILGRTDYRNIIIFQSLSKRSNAPGMRSGFVAGDARLIKPFVLYRTYHGSAMNPMIQVASIAAWNEESHVIENRRLYREKFAAAQPLINSVLEAPMPQASFYLWVKTPVSDDVFARELYRQAGITVLPGSYLSREAFGINAGENYVRLALVATPDEVREASARIVDFVKSNY